ncbi:MAG: polyhydroxyalkanoate depolymerase [Rhizobiaceae bacterium]|nr:polyhydroxyalkanoate depolymerase [Rhizobiaceae bacterium]
MFYHMFEMSHAAMSPMRVAAEVTKHFYSNPLNPVSHTAAGKQMAAMCEVFERTTRRYGKPEFGITSTLVDGVEVEVIEQIVWERSYCDLLHFERQLGPDQAEGPNILIVAPMSGHYATLLRGTVEKMMQHGNVYITDWKDARMVPSDKGNFDLDDYIDYIIDIIHHIGPNTHIMAVCQPSVPVLAAAAIMEARKDKILPASMTLMGGPVDTRKNPTVVNKLAEDKGIDWFKDNVVMTVPFPHPGFMRQVYPGFLQLSGFMSMNLDRHVLAHKEFFGHLIEGDGDSAEKHREFYDEYSAVMDLDAEYYLQTVQVVFIDHALPKGTFSHRGELIDCSKIKNIALMTVEGENDDISGLGQTEAAHTICSNLPKSKRVHYMQPEVGHYGVFNGSRFRSEIAPRIVDFMLKNAHKED